MPRALVVTEPSARLACRQPRAAGRAALKRKQLRAPMRSHASVNASEGPVLTRSALPRPAARLPALITRGASPAETLDARSQQGRLHCCDRLTWVLRRLTLVLGPIGCWAPSGRQPDAMAP